MDFKYVIWVQTIKQSVILENYFLKCFDDFRSMKINEILQLVIIII